MFFTGLGIVLWAANTPHPDPLVQSSPAFASREILLEKLLRKVLTHDLRVRR